MQCSIIAVLSIPDAYTYIFSNLIVIVGELNDLEKLTIQNYYYLSYNNRLEYSIKVSDKLISNYYQLPLINILR